MTKLGSFDPADSPFDDSTCSSCERSFGLGLGEAARSECKNLCTECYQRELTRLAYEQAEANGEEPSEGINYDREQREAWVFYRHPTDLRFY